jgi:hypothetical protein
MPAFWSTNWTGKPELHKIVNVDDGRTHYFFDQAPAPRMRDEWGYDDDHPGLTRSVQDLDENGNPIFDDGGYYASPDINQVRQEWERLFPGVPFQDPKTATFGAGINAQGNGIPGQFAGHEYTERGNGGHGSWWDQQGTEIMGNALYGAAGYFGGPVATALLGTGADGSAESQRDMRFAGLGATAANIFGGGGGGGDGGGGGGGGGDAGSDGGAFSSSTGNSTLTGGTGTDTGANMGEDLFDDFSTGGSDGAFTTSSSSDFSGYTVDPNTGDVIPNNMAAEPPIDDFATGGTNEGVFSSTGQSSDPGLLDMLKNVPDSVKSILMKAIPGLFNADGSLNMAKAGLGASLIGGLLQNPNKNNPLVQPLVDAVRGANSSAGAIQALRSPGITPSVGRAISNANDNVGAWKPYTDSASAFMSSGGAPISGDDISRYMSPYVEQALAPAARKVSEAAALQQQQDAARAGARGAFGTERNDQILGLDKRNELTALGDLYGQGYNSAYTTALSTAGADKSRALSAGGAFSSLGTNVSGLHAADTTNLMTAGGAEALPFTEDLSKNLAAAQAFSGAAGAAKGAIPFTGTPNKLGQAIGALGTAATSGIFGS